MSMGPTEYDRGWADAMRYVDQINTITTDEQLKDVPIGAAIRDKDGNILVLDSWFTWLEPGGSDLTPILPVQLLWHPSWPSPVIAEGSQE